VLPGPSIRTVEIYVPYEEFLKVADKPEGTVMSLEEYRALVGASLARTIGIRAADEMLPKQRCTLSDAQYTGSAREHAARVDHREAFVLSLLDGESSLEELAAAADLPGAEVLAIIRELCARGIVSLDRTQRATLLRAALLG